LSAAGRAKDALAPDVAAGAAVIRRHRHHVHDLGDGQMKWPSESDEITMVVLDKIYVRTGDDSTTAPGAPHRRPSGVSAFGQ